VHSSALQSLDESAANRRYVKLQRRLGHWRHAAERDLRRLGVPDEALRLLREAAIQIEAVMLKNDDTNQS
jgi:hypothetical protein